MAVYEEAVAFLGDHKTAAAALLWLFSLAVFAYAARRQKRVYLLDYSCFKPDPSWKSSYEISEYFVKRSRRFSDESVEFMRGVFLKSGLGDETYVPSYVLENSSGANLAMAIREAEEGIFSAVDSLLAKANVPVSLIDVVVVTSSVLWPAPSLTAMIVNHCKLNPDVKTYNLSGMGCGGGALATDLATRILRRRANSYALVVATESTSLNWYFGNNRSMLVANCIFRMGASAALLTTDGSRRRGAMMELLTSLRTHHGDQDDAYGCAVVQEDDDGTCGIELSKDLVRVAGASLREHIRSLAIRILPVSELLKYAGAAAKAAVKGGKAAAPPPYVPDFTLAFKHICFHPGGKAVINTLWRLMRLPEEMVEPARMTLHRFGNTSSSAIFYELAYFDAKRRIKKGDKMWMLAFGSGFKVCSLVWVALRDSQIAADNPWADVIHVYPVKAPT